MGIDSVSDTASDKAYHRRQARDRRKAFCQGLTPNQRQALSQHLAEIAAPYIAQDVIVASYSALAYEISPDALVARLQRQGCRIALPQVLGADRPLQFAAYEEAFPLQPGPISAILEPPSQAPLYHPQVVLVPLVAVDKEGHRLGQGQGYYDRTLAHLRRQGPVLCIGLAYACQIVQALPHDPWDQPLDAIATPEAWFETPQRHR